MPCLTSRRNRRAASARYVSRIAALLGLVAAAACSSAYDSVAAPSGGNGGGTVGGGPAGAVTVGGGIQYVSRHNGSMNPAVDTIAVGDTVTWTWTGGLSHGVRSSGTPSFPSSGTLTGGASYRVVFPIPGTYRYDCTVHGTSMTGTIVVLGTASASQTTTDPIADTFETAGEPWDLTALTITHDTIGVILRLDFVNAVALPQAGDPSSLVGLVELDLDQNPATGHAAVADQLRRDGGSTGMGVDAGIDLGSISSDSTVVVYDALGHETGRGRVSLGGHRITIGVPRSLLGNDDGFLDAAAIVGTRFGASDVAPQSGSLGLRGAPWTVLAPPNAARGARLVRQPSERAGSFVR